jgi:hypothetical protein
MHIKNKRVNIHLKVTINQNNKNQDTDKKINIFQCQILMYFHMNKIRNIIFRK